MKVVVLTGSPHENGTSFVLADSFIKGAEEAGHSVFRFDAAQKTVYSCIGCDVCGQGDAACIFDDDMQELIPPLISADMVVFVSPVYYSGFTSQIKAVIDRFYGIDKKLCGAQKSSALLVTAADTDVRTARGIQAVYEEAMHYLNWEDKGQIYAIACAERGDIEKTEYPEKAYILGKSL